MSDGLNAAPELHAQSDERRTAQEYATESDPEARDAIDSLEIFGARGRPSMCQRTYSAAG